MEKRGKKRKKETKKWRKIDTKKEPYFLKHGGILHGRVKKESQKWRKIMKNHEKSRKNHEKITKITKMTKIMKTNESAIKSDDLAR
jgi:hypothetical protein